MRPAKKLTKYGKWAIVTGATDGIGRAYCFELAKRGLNVCAISSTQSRLDELQKELSAKYSKLSFSTIAIDFADFNPDQRSKVSVVIDQLGDIGVVINNVGLSYDFPSYFTELTDQTVHNLIELNCSSVTWMTRLVLGGMEKRGRGAIINISSAASLGPSPLLSQYAAAKSYVDAFSLSLAAEVKSKGIDVQVQNPLFVVSKLSKIKRASLTVPSPATYVKYAARFIGHDVQSSPYPLHALQLYVMDKLPSFIVTKIVSNMHHNIRKRALKKLATEPKKDK